MFKNLILFRCEGTMPESADDLERAMADGEFVPCAASEPEASGWIAPREKHGALIESVGGQWIVKLQLEDRILPSSVVKRETEKRADKIEAETGRRPKGKALRELKEELFAELLPKSFTRLSAVSAWIDPQSRMVAVDASSSARAEKLVARLVAAMPKANLHNVATALSPSSAMATWLASEDHRPATFSVDRECELKQPDSEKAAVRYARHTLDIAQVGDHIRQGKLPTRLALTWKGRVSFVLTEHLQIKRLEFLEGVFNEQRAGGGEADAFDADVAIMTGELGAMLPELLEELGGVLLPAIIEACADDKPAPHTGDGPDPLYAQACTLVRKEGKASISLVQRVLRIGYNRAARLLETMEHDRLVSPMDGKGNRVVLAANDAAADAAAAA